MPQGLQPFELVTRHDTAQRSVSHSRGQSADKGEAMERMRFKVQPFKDWSGDEALDGVLAVPVVLPLASAYVPLWAARGRAKPRQTHSGRK